MMRMMGMIEGRGGGAEYIYGRRWDADEERKGRKRTEERARRNEGIRTVSFIEIYPPMLSKLFQLLFPFELSLDFRF